MDDIDDSMNAVPAKSRRIDKKECLRLRRRIQRAIVQLLHTFDCVIDESMEQRFSEVTDDFIHRAYAFDPDISEGAVYQAARNVMIMNTMQDYLGKKVALTSSVFAYSMLYPYTDNYLDALGVEAPAKHAANEHLRLRLGGIPVPPCDRHERIIDTLVSMIEEEFDRNCSAGVYESLLAIHRAQVRSVSQCGGDDIAEDKLLDISIEKGGTSVLADGYLVAGDLPEPDALFFFRFGVLLQLIDDLQDLEEDRRGGQRTLAGAMAENNLLQDFTTRLLSFLMIVTRGGDDAKPEKQQKLCMLIERSCRLLIYEAIALHHHWYSDQFLTILERYSPVRFHYLRAVQQRRDSGHKSFRTVKSEGNGKSHIWARQRILECVREGIL